MNWGSFLFSFQGRINRAKYWLAVLIYLLAGLVERLITLGTDALMDVDATASLILSVLSLVLVVGQFVSSLAVGVKRLHDGDKSGWWLIVFYVVPGLLGGVAVAAAWGAGSADDVTGQGFAVIAIACGVVALAVAVWAFVVLGCLRGSQGPNRFGPDPIEAPVT